MATTTSPLFSLGASGQIGKSIVYSDWKGVSYARQYKVPANPKTAAQTATREAFQWVHDAYKYLDPRVQASWIEYAKGQPFTPANAWMTANLSLLKGAANIDNIIFSKPVNSGPPTPSFTATPGAGSITATVPAPTLPTGWTITQCIGIAMQDVTPAGEMEKVISAAAAAPTAPYTLSFTGLLHAQKYVVGAWFQVLRSDMLNAYGGSANQTVTTS